MRGLGQHHEDFLEAELSAAIGGATCPVCGLARETERAVVSWLANTNIRDEATVAKLVEARGLCSSHWAGVLRHGRGDLGVSGSRLLSRIAAAAAADLRAGTGRTRASCPVCASVARRERSALEMLFAALAEPRKLAAYRSSPGLCRPHLASAAELAPGRSVLNILVETHRRSMLALVEQLDAATTDPERRSDAIQRAIELLVGAGFDGR